jgi:hypothetical protein
MWRQTLCLNHIKVKGKDYHNFRFSQYALTEGEMLSYEDFKKRAMEYFGRELGKLSGNSRTYDESDLQSWRGWFFGYEESTEMPFSGRAIGFESRAS